MNTLLTLRIVGALIAGIGALQLVPLAAAAGFGEPFGPYLGSAVAALAVGLPLAIGIATDDRRVRARDAFVIVTFGWLAASVFGALPYVAAGALAPVDALFESVAGFTTTASTALASVERAPRALLLWRALTQWAGGMGVVWLAVIVLPTLGLGGMQLLRGAIPEPPAGRLRARSVVAARLGWIYAGLTLAAWIAFRLAGMGPFDALCHALTTPGTGGFSTRDASIGAFASPAIEWVVLVFMLCGAVSFVLHYRLLAGRPRWAAGDGELRLLLLAVAAGTAVVAASLVSTGADGRAALRASLFQVASAVSGTGYVSADFGQWPALAKLVLLQLMIAGGMAGSTTGGVKLLRVVLGLRALRAALSRLGHPRAVLRPVLHRGRRVSDEALAGVWAFLIAHLLLVAAASGWIAASGHDLETAVSAAVSAAANVGPGLGAVGPHAHHDALSAGVKLVLAACMIAGRLELFAPLVLLQPGFWRQQPVSEGATP